MLENPLATELNQTIKAVSASTFDLFSDYGRRLYFPKGILLQSAEAKEKAHRFNATIGIATEAGGPMHLPLTQALLKGSFTPEEVYPYAPSTGIPKLRDTWAERQKHLNPSLNGKATSLPMVTSGLTHGITIFGEMFINPGDTVLIADKLWGNYRLMFENKLQAKLETFSLFDAGLTRLNVANFGEKLAAQKTQKKLILLNFPNNPCGYTPTRQEYAAIKELLVKEAEKGVKIAVLCDDAYFGLFFEEECATESLFADLCDLHENIVAVKVDGCTKEAFMWGARVGFITIGTKGATKEYFAAMEKKMGGAIRSIVSNGPNISQNLALKTLRHPAYDKEMAVKHAILQERYQRTKEECSKPEYREIWDCYPFNSGYFMTMRLKHVQAETLRQHLLNRHGLGTISVSEYDLRIAFSSVNAADVPAVFALIAQGARELQG